MPRTQQEETLMSGFWWKWMTGWCWAVAFFGIVLAGGGLEVTSGPVRIFFDLLNGPGELDLDAYMRFSLGVLGPITVGWSLTVMAAMKAANQLEEQAAKPIWVLVVASVACWFVLDSFLSVHTGFWRNTIPNLIYMAAFLLPVIRSGVLSK